MLLILDPLLAAVKVLLQATTPYGIIIKIYMNKKISSGLLL